MGVSIYDTVLTVSHMDDALINIKKLVYTNDTYIHHICIYNV